MSSVENLNLSVLTADSDPNFLASAKKIPGSILTPVVVKTAKEAHTTISNRSQRLIAIVIGSTIEEPFGLPLIRFCRLHRPSIPIFFLHDGEPPFKEDEKEQLGIHAILKRPITYPQIAEMITPHLISFNPSQASEVSDEIPVGKEFSARDLNFTAVNAEDYLSGTKAVFDLFIRLNQGNYVKILQKNENFDPERLLSYLKKGVKSFYLEKAAHVRYLAYCEHLTTNMLKTSTVSSAAKAKTTLAHGQETVNFLKSQGLNSGTLQFAMGFISNVEAFATSSNIKKNPQIADFVNDFERYEHGVAITLLSGILGKSLRFDGERAVQLLGLASLFHDVGLQKLSSSIQDEDESKMSEEELKEYHTHPKVGAELLAQLRIDPVVLQAVAQHHERRTRKGFPAQLGAGSINRIAEIIGICDEFMKLLKQSKFNPSIDVYTTMSTKIFPGFSAEVAEAFQKTFFPNKTES